MLAAITSTPNSVGINPVDIRPTAETGTANGADQNAAAVSANDFLTLLVTEMKNQDPTANTDPNEYINQLVNVNSLQQLISINQTLSGSLATSAPTSDQRSGAAILTSSEVKDGGTFANNRAAGSTAPNEPAMSRLSAGNLGIPQAKPAAEHLAQALSGRSHSW